MNEQLDQLKARLLEASDLEMAGSLLNWDQATYMPPGGAPARARQTATLARLAHERLTDPAVGTLLDGLRSYEESLPFESDDASLIRVTRRAYERAVKVPAAFLGEFYAHGAETFDVWTRARPANDFKMVEPRLQKQLDYSRRLADFFPGYEHPADPLIDYSDYGMKASDVRAVFGQLRAQLVPLIEAVTAQPPADDACVLQRFPAAQQLAFGLEVIAKYGYDFDRGRQDKTHHPFCTKFSLGDVRITTRVKENDLREALFSTVHESGHAMYEQGIDRAFEGTPLGGGTSSGVHESQSRLWENLVGRSRGFWEHFYPRLQAAFPTQLGKTPLDAFYRAINKVERSLIRTDADELTYNLHVILRFEFECQLLEGTLKVRDLPEAWRERYRSDLGVVPPDDTDGVLQDVHWYAGQVGGSFQGYTLGNIMTALWFEQATKAHPGIPGEIRQGKFGTLHAWLRENIYRHGSKFTAAELLQRVTGGPLRIEPYIAYLKSKYGDLYGVRFA